VPVLGRAALGLPHALGRPAGAARTDDRGLSYPPCVVVHPLPVTGA
jgi:hypothetical protein